MVSVLRDIEVPLLGKIYNLFLYIENYKEDSKMVSLKLILPKNFAIKDLIIFEIKKKVEKLDKKVEIDIIYFDDLDEFYSLFQR